MSDFTDYEADDESEDNDDFYDEDPEFDEDSETFDEDDVELDEGEEDFEESEEEGDEESAKTQDEVFPNGYTRKQYIASGFTNNDIATWGLDQNAAPRPGIARKMILDSLDEYLGKGKEKPEHSQDDLSIFH